MTIKILWFKIRIAGRQKGEMNMKDIVTLELERSEVIDVLVALATMYSTTKKEYYGDIYDKINATLKGENYERK